MDNGEKSSEKMAKKSKKKPQKVKAKDELSKFCSRGHACIGLFAGHKSVHETNIRGFAGYCAVLRVKERMDDDDFKDHLISMMHSLKKISDQHEVHCLDGIEYLINSVEAMGVQATDELFNTAVLAALIMMGESYAI